MRTTESEPLKVRPPREEEEEDDFLGFGGVLRTRDFRRFFGVRRSPKPLRFGGVLAISDDFLGDFPREEEEAPRWHSYLWFGQTPYL